ncbi:MAG: hypothetical protein ACRYF2_23375 [Janthinobacterium lividum]
MGKRRHHAPGWSATSLLFGDALDCLSGTSFSVSGGFSYKLTDLSLGRPIAQGTETFSFDPQFDLAGPSDFFVLFSAPNGPLLACAGNTATGCDGPASAVPAPGSVPVLATGMVLLGLCGVCRSMPRLIPVLLAIGSMWAGHAQARITRIVADSRTPAYNGTVQGNAGAYETITGRTFGTLDPTTPQNSIIQDIQLSPKSAPGPGGLHLDIHHHQASGHEPSPDHQRRPSILWWSDYADVARGRPAAGLLDACRATQTCPYIFETFGATEF